VNLEKVMTIKNVNIFTFLYFNKNLRSHVHAMDKYEKKNVFEKRPRNII
jgi:hypothetical protein